MKKFFYLIIFIFWVFIITGKELNIKEKYLNDFTGILSRTDIKSLNELLFNLDKKEKIDFKIIIINSKDDYDKNENSFEVFVRNIFNSEKLNFSNKERAILLVISIKDRKLHIEYGNQINEKEYDFLIQIIDKKIISKFKHNQFARGIYDGIREFALKVNKNNWSNKMLVYFFIFLLSLIFLLIVFLINKKKTKIEKFGKAVYGKW